MNLNWRCKVSGLHWCLIDFLSVRSHVKANRGGDEKGWFEQSEQAEQGVTSMGIIKLDSEGGPSTVVVDNIPKGIVRSERSKDLRKEAEASTSGGEILLTGLSPASRLTESDLLRIRF
ncbi:hypothetical protein ACOSQ3_024217 [Xanthoceras sorbifolium]